MLEQIENFTYLKIQHYRKLFLIKIIEIIFAFLTNVHFQKIIRIA